MSKVEIEKINQILSSLWKKEDFDGDRVTYNQALQDVQIALDSLEEEPVSEDLEKAARQYGDELDNILVAIGDNDDNTVGEYASQAYKAGALRQKEQMMANAVEREVKVDAGGYPYIDATELYDYDKEKPLAKQGDKVKVIILNDNH